MLFELFGGVSLHSEKCFNLDVKVSYFLYHNPVHTPISFTKLLISECCGASNNSSRNKTVRKF